jgi:hypothetical protein
MCVSALFSPVFGQEYAGHLNYNALLSGGPSARLRGANAKTTVTADTLTLPFFEDFTGYGFYPDSTKWVDYEVYINNTMGASPISRGVATFDALDSHGYPYDSFSNIDFRYCDSLTSQPINIAGSLVSDSIYFSFFFQPQGNGFYPLPEDSLMLYFKDRYGGFVKIWATPGTTLHPFQQIMIPITDTLYYHNSFQFRFVNKAALYWADAVWNVDYIRLDRNRYAGDTIIQDVGFTSNPTFLLNDYSYMPYNQFYANPLGEIVTQVSDSIRNSGPAAQNVDYSFAVNDITSGAVISPATAPASGFVLGRQTQQVTGPLSTSTFPAYPPGSSVVFETQYSLSAPGSGTTANDTIVKDQVFDNYLAYDDGSAEKSYYLILSPTLPGRIAIEFHLNYKDTLRGMAIYFGRQAPYPSYKNFDIFVWSALGNVNGASVDEAIDSQQFLIPEYTDSQNHFWVYTFDNPLPLPMGTFYAGTRQDAGANDDTLYFGLDVNRIGSNHAYFNVLNTWQQSLISGAIMMRPILGRRVSGTSVSSVQLAQPKWQVSPNPATDRLQLQMETEDQHSAYRITDILGHCVLQGAAVNNKVIDISSLAPGMYLVNILNNGVAGAPQKIVKL